VCLSVCGHECFDLVTKFGIYMRPFWDIKEVKLEPSFWVQIFFKGPWGHVRSFSTTSLSAFAYDLLLNLLLFFRCDKDGRPVASVNVGKIGRKVPFMGHCNKY
jgi:hypothetical protein